MENKPTEEKMESYVSIWSAMLFLYFSAFKGLYKLYVNYNLFSFFQKVVCAYLNRSIFTENISLTEVISIEQFREFTALADKADAQNLTGNIRAASDVSINQLFIFFAQKTRCPKGPCPNL